MSATAGRSGAINRLCAEACRHRVSRHLRKLPQQGGLRRMWRQLPLAHDAVRGIMAGEKKENRRGKAGARVAHLVCAVCFHRCPSSAVSPSICSDQWKVRRTLPVFYRLLSVFLSVIVRYSVIASRQPVQAERRTGGTLAGRCFGTKRVFTVPVMKRARRLRPRSATRMRFRLLTLVFMLGSAFACSSSRSCYKVLTNGARPVKSSATAASPV